jgi:hypothetical protein
VLYGTGRIVSVDHSFYALDGFTIDGQEKLAGVPFPIDLAAVDAFKDSVQSQVSDGRLIYVGAADSAHDLTGITINNMFLNGAGGECLRLRNNAHHNAVTGSVIQYCGMYGKGGSGRATYHNGEGVYIGTSPKSTDQPMHDKRWQLVQRRRPKRHPNLRLRVLQREGKRPRQRVRGQHLRR